MSDSTVGQIDPYDGMDLGAYRYAVARLLRLLIRARLTQEPEFLDPAEQRCWQLDTFQDDSRGGESILIEAVKANDVLYNTLLGPVNSMGIAADDPRSELKEKVILLVQSIWSWADQSIIKLQDGEQVDWDEIIPIDKVRIIRDGLDALPHPAKEASGTPDGPVPPSLFRWNGKTAELTPKPWALVNFLWKQPVSEQNGEDVRCSDFFTIAREVWDNEDVALGRAINSTASRANGMFKGAGVPIRLSICKPNDRNQFVTLVISDTDA